VATVVGPPTSSNSPYCHPTSPRTRQLPLSPPLFEFAHSQPGFQVQNETVLFGDFWEFYDALFSTDGQVGVPIEISSWLLPKEVIETDKPAELAAELLKVSGFGYL
jgi:hypothetical protein